MPAHLFIKSQMIQKSTTLLTIILYSMSITACTVPVNSSFKNRLHNFSDAASNTKEIQPPNRWNLEQPPSLNEIKEVVKNDQVESKMNEIGDWWLYGPGMGRTALNVGTVIIFPPYALYLLTNAGLSLAGYQPLNIFKALPDEPREIAESTYDSVTKVPGRITALATGKEFYQ